MEVDSNINRGILLSEDTIDTNDLNNLSVWLQSGPQLTKGPLVRDFEGQFASTVGSQFAVFVNSGSSANLLLVSALAQSGRLRNRRVLCPAISWVTTVTPFIELGFEVQLVDADKKNLGLDVHHLEKLLKATDASVVSLVNVLGHPNHMREIQEVCQKYGAILIEDSCEALGSRSASEQMLGTIGLAGTYSLYFGHHISTIEGGVVVTDDFDLYQLMLSIRSHGWSRDLDNEFASNLRAEWGVSDFKDLYTFYFSGYNLRPTELQAFLGISQLRKLDWVSSSRFSNDLRYRNKLSGFWHQDSDYHVLSPFAFGTFVEDPGELHDKLRLNGVQSRPLICGNIGRHPFWTKLYGPTALEMADFVDRYGIYLPNHPGMSESQVDFVCEIVRSESVPIHPPS